MVCAENTDEVVTSLNTTPPQPRARPLVAIVGPTAVGKSALALRLAPRWQGEIVSADSRYLYRFMDIGTATPTPEELAAVPHHLINILDPDQPFSLAEYQELAYRAIEDILARGRLPFLVGGTGQYVWAVLEGWQVPHVPPDPALRARLAERARIAGPLALHRELAAVDPVAAARIHPHNVRRVIRALEVYYHTGQPISAQQTARPPDYQTLIIGLTLPRAELYRRIDQRFDEMVARGWVEEVRRLLERGYSPDLPSMTSLGYREIVRYLRGECTLDAALRRVKAQTHRFARQQYTWFRLDDPRIHWLTAGPEAEAQAEALIRDFLAALPAPWPVPALSDVA